MKYSYHCRPGYGSGKLLIEFISGVGRSTFGEDLFDALKGINPKISGKADLWENDEALYEVNSEKGNFTLSRDNWDIAFIMSDKDQDCISFIDSILSKDERYEKVEVDFDKYLVTKKTEP